MYEKLEHQFGLFIVHTASVPNFNAEYLVVAFVEIQGKIPYGMEVWTQRNKQDAAAFCSIRSHEF